MQYYLKRSKRRKRIAITINSYEGKVMVYAPESMPLEKINDFVNKKKSWINKYLKLAEERRALLPKLCDDEKIYIAGKEYVLRIEPRNSVAIGWDNYLFLPDKNTKAYLFAFAKKVFLPYVTQKTEYFANKYNFSFKSVKITSKKGEWGSCTVDNRISFVIEAAFLPEKLLNYLVLHELCHTVQKNHQKGFYALFTSILPNNKELSKELKNYTCFLRYFKNE